MFVLKRLDQEVAPKIDLDVSQEFQSTFKERLDYLLEKAPSDASLFSKILKIKKGYEGAIEIISSQRKFIATAIRMDPNDLAFELVDQIYRQILKWRNERILLMQ